MKVKNRIRILVFSLCVIGAAFFSAQGTEAASVTTVDLSKNFSGDQVVCDSTNTLYRFTGRTVKNKIIIKGGTASSKIRVDLNGVDMDLTNQAASPVSVESGYAVIYMGQENSSAQNTLRGGKNGYAGLCVKDNADCTISGQGKLTAFGGGSKNGGAGIGGNNGETMGTLTIDGNSAMEINATGGYSAAGIGSGYKGTVCSLTIKNGTVKAYGGEYGAGIGVGDDGKGSGISISGGNITAKGGFCGAGIGGGDSDRGGDLDGLVISGGTIKATGGDHGSGIGTGDWMDVENLSVTGGVIEAVGGEYGAGIGGGDNAKMKGLFLGETGSPKDSPKIKAIGGKGGAGIGSVNGDCERIIIYSGEIYAQGGEQGAGIGSGHDARMDWLQIFDGDIEAIGGVKAAGIGAGDHEDGGDGGDLKDLRINGGTIKATGGRLGAGMGGSDCGTADGIYIHETKPLSITAVGGEKGAGIGSANHSVRDMTIMLNGGSITATGGEEAAGIGGGSGDTGKIGISGKGTIKATGGCWGAGIGAGRNSGSGEITINGSSGSGKERLLKIDAVVDTKNNAPVNTTAAIGSGRAGSGDITIKNAMITANSDGLAATIGSGKRHSVESGGIHKISIDNCKISASGNVKSGAGIGSGDGGGIAVIEIKDSEYVGNTIGSGSDPNNIGGTPNDIDSITIENSKITAKASKPNNTDVKVPWAGIGSGPWGSVGSITIKKSDITAKPNAGGAAIGSGGWIESPNILEYYGGKMGDILIEDSKINAQGGAGGAGIGGGFDTSTGNITINSSQVTAETDTKAANGAAAIGGGRGADAGDIRINNSTVTAKGGTNSAAIGSSGERTMLTNMWQTKLGSVSITNGSEVDAVGGEGGAGVGTGRGANLSGHISITDSKVTAKGGAYGAGIGGGSKGAGVRGGDTHDITISGKSRVEASGGEGAAGIGAGLQGGADDLTFDLTTTADRQYYVKARGGAGAAGIGSGSPNETGHELFTQEGYRTNNVTIKGGSIHAWGGGNRQKLGSGAGIGGGARKGTLHGFTVTGGYVEAHSGAKDAFDIGHGGEGGVSQAFHDADFRISGGTVTAERISTDRDWQISGGSVRCRVNAKDANGSKVYQTTLTLADETDTLIASLQTSESGYGAKDIFSQGKRLYLYLPESKADEAWADVGIKSGDTRHYYGTTTPDGKGVLKMGGILSFKGTEPSPAVGEDFTLSLEDDNLAGWTFRFGEGKDSAASIKKVEQAAAPGARVILHGNAFGDFSITATSDQKKDDPVYWSLAGTYNGKITREKGSIAITENPSKTYDGEQIEDPAVEKNGDGKVTYRYYKGRGTDGEALAERPKNTGTYTVTAVMAASEHYSAATSDPLTFTIEKRPVVIGLSAAGKDAKATITAAILGAVDANGKVKFTVEDTKGNKKEAFAAVKEQGGRYAAEWDNEETPAEDYAVTAEYIQSEPVNYSCEPVSQNFKKELAFRKITGEDSFHKTYGDDEFSLNAGIESGTATTNDKWTYEVVYEEYPKLEKTISVDGAGQVTISNAGRAAVKITLSDGKSVYNDAVKYIQVTVKRAVLTVTSSAKQDEIPVTKVQYGKLNRLDYQLTYEGFKNGDNAENFTKGHGTLKAVPLVPTLGVTGGADSYSIPIVKVGGKEHNIFLSRNYRPDLKNGKIEVTPAPLTVKAKDAVGQWGTEPTYSYFVEGLTAWDTEQTLFSEKPKAGLDTEKTGGKEYTELEPGTYPDVISVTKGIQKRNQHGEENYAIVTAPGTLTVGKAKVGLELTAVSKTYDKKPAEVTVTTPEGYDGKEPELKYYEITGDGNISDPKVFAALQKSAKPLEQAPVDAGRYYVEATAEATDHFYGSKTARAAFAIFKANPNPEIPELPDMQIKRDLILADQALPEGWEWHEPKKELSIGEVRALARYTPQDTRNYRIVYRYLEFSVTKEDPTKEKGHIAIIENPSKTYDGEAVADPSVEKNGDGKVTYRYYEGRSTDGKALAERPKNAGTYTVAAIMATSEHYTAAMSAPRTFVIEKRPVVIGLSAAGKDAKATITATILGAVDANGKVKFTVEDTKGNKKETFAEVKEQGGLYIAEWGNVETPADDYTVTAEYIQSEPVNYSCEPVSQNFKKNLAFREITGEDSFHKTYGDDGFSLNAGIESGKATDSDKWIYEVVYEEYPKLEETISVDGTGQVTISNAGRAAVKITLSDGKRVYNDAVKYIQVTVKRTELTVASYAKKNKRIVKSTEYGTLDALEYGLAYKGFKFDDNAENFTKGHGTLKAVPLVPTLGVTGEADSYSIPIVKVGSKEYDDIFLSRNYRPNLKNGKIEVTPAPLAVKGKDAAGKWKEEPKYSYFVEGLTAWDTEQTVFTKKPKAGLDTEKTGGKAYTKLEPGTYPDAISVTKGIQKRNKYGEENYVITTAPGTLTIYEPKPDNPSSGQNGGSKADSTDKDKGNGSGASGGASTGDEGWSRLWTAIALTAASAGVLGTLCIRRKRNQEKS